MRERWRTVVTICFIAVLLVPIAGSGDGVPLSSYPMYASVRSPEVTFIVPVGLAVSGEEVALSPLTIAGTIDPLIGESFLRDEVAGGRADALCATIASRVVEPQIVRIEIRSDRIHVVDQVLGTSAPLSSEVLASCPVS